MFSKCRLFGKKYGIMWRSDLVIVNISLPCLTSIKQFKKIYTNICSQEKSIEFTKSSGFPKSQADLRNLGALQKNRRIYKILALFRKIGGFEKSWCFTEKQANLQNLGGFQKNWRTIESWRALKSPRLVKNHRDWKKLVACLLFRLGGISSCWLPPGLAEELSFRSSQICCLSLMQTPSERTAQAALLSWADSLPYCTGCLYRPDMPKFMQKSKF